MQIHLILLLSLFLSASLYAGTDILVGSKETGKDSRHLTSFSVLSLDSTIYNLLGSSWVVGINPEIYLSPRKGRYDGILHEGYLARTFRNNSRLEVGKNQMWILNQVYARVGVEYAIPFSNFGREFKIEIGKLQKHYEYLDHVTGDLAKLSYIDQALLPDTMIETTFFSYKDANKDSRETGYDVKVNFEKNKYLLGAYTQSYGSSNTGFGASLGYSKTILSYKKLMKRTLMENEDEDVFLSLFKHDEDSWVTFSMNEWDYLYLEASLNQDKKGYKDYLISTTIFNQKPYLSLVQLKDSEFMLAGVKGSYMRIEYDLGGGVIDSVRKTSDDNILYGELGSHFRVGQDGFANIKLRYITNEWMDNDTVASAFYKHTF